MSTKKEVSSKKSETSSNNADVNAKEIVMKNEWKKMGGNISKIVVDTASTAKYAALAGETVKKLDGLAKTSVETWVEMGRLVHEFVQTVTNDGEISINAHEILANTPGSYHTADMLRKYDGAFMLWQEMKERGFTANVSMSHLLAVLHCAGSIEDKIALLKDAENRKLSVRATKKMVAKRFPSTRAARTSSGIGGDYKTAVKEVKSIIDHCSEALSTFAESNNNKPLPKTVQKSLVGLVELAVSQGLLVGGTKIEKDVTATKKPASEKGSVGSEKKEKAVSGVGEWAASSVNCFSGCPNNCSYCFSRANAVRFKRCSTKEWKTPVVNQKAVEKDYNKRDGTIMFPSSFDITPDTVDASLIVLKKLLAAGNNVLIVSKPVPSCIKKLCKELKEYKNQILFRFTIGSASNKVLKLWEENAPTFQNRIKALKIACKAGFKTSLSCEPMLDGNIHKVIKTARPFVTDSIWLGLANGLRLALSLNCPGNKKIQEKATELINLQDDAFVHKLYETYRNDPLIKWKDSLKKKLGLERPTEKGLDV